MFILTLIYIKYIFITEIKQTGFLYVCFCGLNLKNLNLDLGFPLDKQKIICICIFVFLGFCKNNYYDTYNTLPYYILCIMFSSTRF